MDLFGDGHKRVPYTKEIHSTGKLVEGFPAKNLSKSGFGETISGQCLNEGFSQPKWKKNLLPSALRCDVAAIYGFNCG